MDAFEAQAHRMFPGSTVIHRDTYDIAKARLLDYVKSLADTVPDRVDRWKIACRAAIEALLEPEPHGLWAAQMLDTDLTKVLATLHTKGEALDYPTVYPHTWPGYLA